MGEWPTWKAPNVKDFAEPYCELCAAVWGKSCYSLLMLLREMLFWADKSICGAYKYGFVQLIVGVAFLFQMKQTFINVVSKKSKTFISWTLLLVVVTEIFLLSEVISVYPKSTKTIGALLSGKGGGIQSIAGNDVLDVSLFQVSALNFKSHFGIFDWLSVIKWSTIRTHSGGSGGKLGSGIVMLGLQ